MNTNIKNIFKKLFKIKTPYKIDINSDLDYIYLLKNVFMFNLFIIENDIYIYDDEQFDEEKSLEILKEYNIYTPTIESNINNLKLLELINFKDFKTFTDYLSKKYYVYLQIGKFNQREVNEYIKEKNTNDYFQDMLDLKKSLIKIIEEEKIIYLQRSFDLVMNYRKIVKENYLFDNYEKWLNEYLSQPAFDVAGNFINRTVSMITYNKTLKVWDKPSFVDLINPK